MADVYRRVDLHPPQSASTAACKLAGIVSLCIGRNEYDFVPEKYLQSLFANPRCRFVGAYKLLDNKETATIISSRVHVAKYIIPYIMDL